MTGNGTYVRSGNDRYYSKETFDREIQHYRNRVAEELSHMKTSFSQDMAWFVKQIRRRPSKRILKLTAVYVVTHVLASLFKGTLKLLRKLK